MLFLASKFPVDAEVKAGRPTTSRHRDEGTTAVIGKRAPSDFDRASASAQTQATSAGCRSTGVASTSISQRACVQHFGAVCRSEETAASGRCWLQR